MLSKCFLYENLNFNLISNQIGLNILKIKYFQGTLKFKVSMIEVEYNNNRLTCLTGC